ncbi:MAG: hypothetical protein PHP03_02800 [Candidatus Pacebacteria bacterium]|nr:hypothetical protein [Candidatus Paceibacterota bacterium]
MNKYGKIALVTIFSIFILANVAGAAGLVPCGGAGEKACGLCDFFKLAQNIITFLMKIAFTLATLFIIYGAFVIMTAGGSPERVTEGKKVLTITFTGVAIILGSWIIMSTLLLVITGSPSKIPWNQVTCSVTK